MPQSKRDKALEMAALLVAGIDRFDMDSVLRDLGEAVAAASQPPQARQPFDLELRKGTDGVYRAPVT